MVLEVCRCRQLVVYIYFSTLWNVQRKCWGWHHNLIHCGQLYMISHFLGTQPFLRVSPPEPLEVPLPGLKQITSRAPWPASRVSATRRRTAFTECPTAAPIRRSLSAWAKSWGNFRRKTYNDPIFVRCDWEGIVCLFSPVLVSQRQKLGAYRRWQRRRQR
jgi:hypothetical protein